MSQADFADEWRMGNVQRRGFFLCLSLLGVGLGIVSARGADLLTWKDWVVRAQSNESARTILKTWPKFEEILAQALSPQAPPGDRAAAIQATKFLGAHTLLPQLLVLAETETGRPVFETLCGQLDAKVEKLDDSKIVIALRSRLGPYTKTPLSAGAKVAILDCFKGLKQELSPDLLSSLLADPSFEVRGAALALAGEYRVNRQLPQYEGLLVTSFEKSPDQLRRQARIWVNRLLKREPASGREAGEGLGNGSRSSELACGMGPWPAPEDECRRFYCQLYSRPEIRMSVVFGNFEARRDGVGLGRGDYIDFIELLRSPCGAGLSGACGFGSVAEDSTLFTKFVVRDGIPVSIVLRVVQAGEADEKQRVVQLSYARDVFLSGLSTADIVFWIGGAPEAGGALFVPTHDDSQGKGQGKEGIGRRDQGRAAFQIMSQALESAGSSRARVIGLFTSASSEEFSQIRDKFRAKTRFLLLEPTVSAAELVERASRALSDLLQFKCGKI